VKEPEEVSAMYCEPAVAVNEDVTLVHPAATPVAPVGPVGPVAPTGPVAPISPLDGPTHAPDELTIAVVPTVMPFLTVKFLFVAKVHYPLN
jgi:hypothetical protein